MSTESPARLRIRRFVEREKELRAHDGLDSAEGREKENKRVWECVGEDLREEVVRWFMDVVPPEEIEDCRAARRTEGSEDGDDACTVLSLFFLHISALSHHLYYDVLRNNTHHNRISNIRSRVSDKTNSPCRTNLVDQLSTSPETRFHAAYLFMRFFWIVGLSTEGSGTRSAEGGKARETWAFGSELDEEGRRLVTWDVGVTCLGISIKVRPTPLPPVYHWCRLMLTSTKNKYHRDFLHPLLPVYAQELMRMAPHGPVGYDDLETAHRDVLGALQFRLGDTPQGMLGEVWEAVPALRRALGGESEAGCGCGCRCTEVQERMGGWRDGWNIVQRETWRALCVAVLEPDVLKYPLSLLTASALLHGLCVIFVRQYEDAKPWYMYELCAGPDSPVASSKWKREREAKAEKMVGHVKKELMELMDLDE
ncbi:hypothetical protein C0992_008145, partial [Termitomyces sp. T32_za158]